jgi:cysteine desulfurase
LFHVDAVQGFGKLPLRPREWGIDLLSISAHKFHGPRGAGILFCRSGVELLSLLTGGGQERGLRSGTENVPAIAAMAKAMQMQAENAQQIQKKLRRLNERMRAGLAAMPFVSINSPENGAPHIINFSLPGLKAEVILHALEEEEIFVSTRSACSSKANKPNRILAAIGLDEARAQSAIRVSFSHLNEEAEVEQFLHALKRVQQKLSIGGRV